MGYVIANKWATNRETQTQNCVHYQHWLFLPHNNGISRYSNAYLMYPLAYWGRDKMAAILQKAFSNVNIFLLENASIFIKNSLKFVSNGALNHNLALVQIITWQRTGIIHYHGLVYWRIYASLNLDELTLSSPWKQLLNDGLLYLISGVPSFNNDVRDCCEFISSRCYMVVYQSPMLLFTLIQSCHYIQVMMRPLWRHDLETYIVTS